MDLAHLRTQIVSVQACLRHGQHILTRACCSGTRGEDLVYKVGPWRTAAFIGALLLWLCFAVYFLPLPATLTGDRLAAYGLGLLFLLVSANVALQECRHTHTVRLHPNGMVDFRSWNARVSIPAQELLMISTVEDEEAIFDLGGVLFHHRGGTIRVWRLDLIDELVARLQVLNPALQVHHGKGPPRINSDEVLSRSQVCRTCQYPNLLDRRRCENCGTALA